jgi:hypothetical protein
MVHGFDAHAIDVLELVVVLWPFTGSRPKLIIIQCEGIRLLRI